MHTVKFSDLKGVPVGCGSGLTENRVFCGHTLKKKANWLKFGRGAISRTRFQIPVKKIEKVNRNTLNRGNRLVKPR